MRAAPLHAMPDLRRTLKVRHFQLLEAVAATRNMRIAADRLGVTAAAVSKGCLEVEGLLGLRLFERSSTGLAPNAACARLLDAGRRIDAELKLLNAEMPGLHGKIQGTVRVGFQAPCLQRTVASAIHRVKTQYPDLTVSFEYGMRERLMLDLQTNRLDLIVVDLFGVEQNPRVECLELARDRCVVAASSVTHLSDEDALDWEFIKNWTWIIPVKGMAMRHILEMALAAEGLEMPLNRIEVNSPLEGHELARHQRTLAYTTQSILASEFSQPAASERKLTRLEEVEIRLGIVWPRMAKVGAAVQAVRETIISAARNAGTVSPFQHAAEEGSGRDLA